MIYLIVLGRYLQYFSEFIDFVFTPLCEKDGGVQKPMPGHAAEPRLPSLIF